MRLSSWTSPRRDRREQLLQNIMMYISIRVSVTFPTTAFDSRYIFKNKTVYSVGIFFHGLP
jgi:hypothetical protein